MIKVLKYGEVEKDEIFARVTPEVNVEDIVSGIIDTREDEVVAALAACGFAITERHENRGWLCLVTRKTA